MEYTKHEFKSGDKLYATQLNEMDEQIAANAEAIDDLQNKTPSDISGLTVGQITALDNLFKVAVFTKNVSAEYAAFKAAFGIEGGGEVEPDEPDEPGIPDVPDTPTYSVTNNLANVTNSNSQTKVTEGFYSATLTVDNGYNLQSVVITMGGVDVTTDVYTAETGTILVTEVTGNIVITALAVKLEVIATKQTGGTNVYAVAPDGTTIYTGSYAKAEISYRSTQSDVPVNVTITNPTESDIKTSLYIGGIENGIGATINLPKVSILNAVCVANNVTIPAGESVTYSGVVPGGYHMGVYCTNTSATVVCYGSLDIYNPVNEYELVQATPTSKWEQYSGNTADESARVISEVVKYMSAEPFAEDTTLRVTVYNSGESAVNISSGAYQILFAIYGNGTDAVGFNVKRLNINAYGPSLDAGCEEFDAEFVVPAGYRFCTSVPASCIYIKKVV